MALAAIRSCALALAGLAMAAPSAAQAQGDQAIVMRCTFDGYTNQTLDYVVDLAARTMTLTHTLTGLSQPIVTHYSGRVTEVTDGEIVWTYTDPNCTVTDTLNRYSGQIVEHVAMSGNNVTALESCRRQQKQF